MKKMKNDILAMAVELKIDKEIFFEIEKYKLDKNMILIIIFLSKLKASKEIILEIIREREYKKILKEKFNEILFKLFIFLDGEWNNSNIDNYIKMTMRNSI